MSGLSLSKPSGISGFSVPVAEFEQVLWYAKLVKFKTIQGGIFITQGIIVQLARNRGLG